MVFIHGGGFVMGSGSEQWFGPDFIVAKNTVLVTMNYRLGILGFLCLDIPEAPGNCGLRDQNLAMKWVVNNIRAFNGDPHNITLFGISAGSASVEFHLLSPMSKGLFHKAILQSGSSLNPWARTRNPMKIAERLAARLGSHSPDPQTMLKFLKEIDVEKLTTEAVKSIDDEDVQNSEIFPFTAVVEKTFPGLESFLDDEPFELLNKKKYNQVPTITGICEHEGHLFKSQYTNHMKKLNQRSFIDFVPSSFKIDRVHFEERLKETYDEKDDDEAVDSFLSDTLFVGGIWCSLRFRLQNHLPNYLYMFTHEGNLNLTKILFKSQPRGGHHGDESSYISTNLYTKSIKPSKDDIYVRNCMVQMWTDFAKNGNPTPTLSKITPKWFPATRDDDQLMMMEIGKQLMMKPSPWTKRMKLWQELYESFE